MKTAADTLSEAHSLLDLLVKAEVRASGSRMTAYDAVARSIGSTGSWVRKLLGRQAVAEPAASVLDNIRERAAELRLLEEALAARRTLIDRLAACEAALGLQGPHVDRNEDLQRGGLARPEDSSVAEGR